MGSDIVIGANAVILNWNAGAAPNNNIVVLLFQITDLKSGTLKYLKAALNKAVFLFTKGHKMHPGGWNFVFQTKSNNNEKDYPYILHRTLCG